MDINLKINGNPVLGTIKIGGVLYYIDTNKHIYTNTDDTYTQVTDPKTLKKILDYITPRSLDVI